MMAYERVLPIRNQGTVRITAEKAHITLQLLAGSDGAMIVLLPEQAKMVRESLDTALLYFDENGGSGE